jgi:transcriptional regulator with XRE-family HTH domain
MEIRMATIGMPKEKFYELSGISSASFSQWNTGAHKPTNKKLAKAAECLGVSLEYLLCGNEDEKKPAPEGELSEERREVLSMIDGMSDKELIRLKQLIKIAKEGL